MKLLSGRLYETVTALPQAKNMFPALSLVLLAVLVYLPAFPGNFFMDDVVIVRDNPMVYDPDLGTMFTSDYWGEGENTGLYRPLTILSFTLNRMLLGHATWSYLLVNLALHIAVALVLYRFLPSLGLRGSFRWFAAALFAVHPFHGEPVIELVGRSELLVALFSLLALLAARKAGRWQPIIVGGFFLAALLSKEHGIVLLALLPAIDFFQERDLKSLLRRRWSLYFVMLGVAVGWVLFRTFGVVRAISDPDVFDPHFVPLATLDYSHRLLMALKVQLLYLGKMLVPFHLQGMYPASTVLPAASWFSLTGVLIVAAVMALVAGFCWGWQRRQVWALALLLYFICFSPTSNIFVLAAVTMADRLAYLPSLWFCTGFAAAICVLAQRLHREPVVAWVVGALMLGYTGAGVVRSLDFRTPERLWRSDLRINPDNPLSGLLLADELWRLKRLDEAEKLYLQLLEKDPNYSEASNAYATLLVELKRYDEAIRQAKHSIKYAVGRFAKAKIPLAAAYVSIGRFDEAMVLLDDSHDMWRFRPAYWELVGRALEGKNELFSALSAYQKEIETKGPQRRDVLRRIARVQLGLKNYREAEKLLRRDLELDESGEAWNSLGTVLALMGRMGEARHAFQQAVRLSPEVQQYRHNLERSLAGGE